MRRLGATRIEAVLGPCIHPCCYPFGAEDLRSSWQPAWASQVRAIDRHGAPALDLPAGVRAALHSSGVGLVGDADVCTSCSDRPLVLAPVRTAPPPGDGGMAAVTRRRGA